jgi:hypothetical protein
LIDFRNVIYSIIIAFITGLLGMYLFIMDNNSPSYLSTLFSATMGKVQLVPAGLALMIIDMYPVFIFEIVFGTLIYKRFCECSAYYFIRQKKRWVWFIKEAFGLFILSIIYWIAYFLVYFSAAGLIKGSFPNSKMLAVTLIMIMIFSVFVFACTLLINAFAIIFGSQRGFIIAFGIQLFFAVFLAFQEKLSDINEKLISFNPVAGLITAWHSIPSLKHASYLEEMSFPLSYSIISVVVLMIIAILVSLKIALSADISLYNKELDA